MRITDYIGQSFMNLRRMKLRTFLTTFGVVIGIAALVSMIAFAQGMQENITKQFNEVGLFNYISVFWSGGGEFGPRRGFQRRNLSGKPKEKVELDEQMLSKIKQISGVDWAFPEVRFPAMVSFNNMENFSYIQALPAQACQSGLIKLKAGKAFDNDDANSVIISETFLESMDFDKPLDAVGMDIKIGTLAIDINNLNPNMIASVLSGEGNPFATEKYNFKIVGVCEQSDFGGPGILRSDCFVPIGTSQKINKVSVASIEDFFQTSGRQKTYSMVRVQVSSVGQVDSIKKKIEDLGLSTFAFTDILKRMRIGFILLNTLLFGIGMIALTVASLGIVNTMVMSILERYREIGIMKAIGAGDDDVKKIIFFETATIGFLGGVFGLILGLLVSSIINFIVNQIIVRQGAPYIDCFSFPWWLCLGAIAFSVLVSLSAGIYPAIRAAKVDPVVALQHD